jgi:hypothetical protein
LRSYTLDGAPAKDENDDGPARCAVKEKYPFSAAANLTEDSIITDPLEIKQIINDQFKASEEHAKKVEEAKIAAEAAEAEAKRLGK